MSKWSRRCTATLLLNIVGEKKQTVRCCGVHSTVNHVGPIPKAINGYRFAIWRDEDEGAATLSAVNPEKYKSSL